jgi:hypothetical protein
MASRDEQIGLNHGRRLLRPYPSRRATERHAAKRSLTWSWDRRFESPSLQRRVHCEPEFDSAQLDDPYDARTKREHEATSDPRPSLEERYGTPEANVAKVKAAAEALVSDRLLLPSDAAGYVRAAEECDRF